MHIYLLRHAQSAPSDDLPEPEWPLSPRGERQARALVTALSPLGIQAICSSPYPRAVATVRPFAQSAGLEITRDDALRERRLMDATLTAQGFHAALQRCWAEPSFAWPGGESNDTCQARMVEAVGALIARHAGKTLLVSSHGNALSLLLGSLDASFGFDGWKAMRNPDLFRLEVEHGRILGPATHLPPQLDGVDA